MKIILGSSSPRRKQILSGLFDCIEIIPPHIDESSFQDENADEFALRISREKNDSVMQAVLHGTTKEYLIITSDTIVEYRNRILQKPCDHEDAFRMLNMLQNKTHNVISAVCISYIKDGAVLHNSSELEISPVKFKHLSEEEIYSYLSVTEYMDKAGSYAIQENGHMIVENFSGSHTNIIGFPLRLFFRIIFDMGMVKTLFNI